MSTETPPLLRRLPERFRPEPSTLLYGTLLVNTELLVVLASLFLSGVQVNDPISVAYPFVWINVGLWAVVRTEPTPRNRRHRYLAVALAGAYLLALFVLGGLLWTASPHIGETLSVSMLTPGAGPVIAYNGPFVRFTFVPFLVVGYVALAYLLYATLLDAAGSALGGVLGLFSCLSCVWPLLTPILVGIFGSGATATVAELQSYRTGTAVFVVTVALLYWRPFKRDQ